MQPFCPGYLLSSCRKTLEFTRQELPVYLSKSLFPETHDSPNLYLMNGAAEVQMYMCYVPDGMQALDFCIQPYSHQGESSYQLPDGTCMGLDCLQVLARAISQPVGIQDASSPHLPSVMDSLDQELLSHVVSPKVCIMSYA